jgi:hypothetical protein
MTIATIVSRERHHRGETAGTTSGERKDPYLHCCVPHSHWKKECAQQGLAARSPLLLGRGGVNGGGVRVHHFLRGSAVTEAYARTLPARRPISPFGALGYLNAFNRARSLGSVALLIHAPPPKTPG